jgi:hypothetical protein
MKLLFSMGIGKPGQLYCNKMVFGQGISTGIPETFSLELPCCEFQWEPV